MFYFFYVLCSVFNWDMQIIGSQCRGQIDIVLVTHRRVFKLFSAYGLVLTYSCFGKWSNIYCFWRLQAVIEKSFVSSNKSKMSSNIGCKTVLLCRLTNNNSNRFKNRHMSIRFTLFRIWKTENSIGLNWSPAKWSLWHGQRMSENQWSIRQRKGKPVIIVMVNRIESTLNSPNHPPLWFTHWQCLMGAIH